MVRKDGEWSVRAAGPTTSSRSEPYLPKLIKDQGVRAVIGKGSMGKAMEGACAGGCVYLHAIGGAARVLAGRVVAVKGVHFGKEFGLAEAMWMLELKDFPAIVAIDTRGRSLFRKVQKEARAAFGRLVDGADKFSP
jgi:fumarate hydratase class I